MLERTASGLEARLRVTGVGRFIGAGFLSFWLIGWVAGEAFALWMLIGGAHSLFTGTPTGAHHQPLSIGLACVGGVFLLFWLTLWTFGGIAAGRELLRLLFGRDCFLANSDGLKVEHSFGLFRSVIRFPRQEIRRFYRTTDWAPLCLETAQGKTSILTRLGAPGERADLEKALNAEFSLEAQLAPAATLPKGWCEVVSLEHDSVLVKDPAIRGRRARTVWIFCACLSLVPLYLFSAEGNRPDLLGALLFFFALAAGAGAGAVWLSFGRKEWRLDQGRLVLQRRFGSNRTTLFEAISLELAEDNSGEDGTSYPLMAVAPGAPARTFSYRPGQHRRTIYSESGDPTGPRNLGLWLSQRCHIAFTDLTRAEAKAKELETLKQQLAGSGRFGRVVLGLIDRLAPSSGGVSSKDQRS